MNRVSELYTKEVMRRAKMAKKVNCHVCRDNVLLRDAIKDENNDEVCFCGFECESIYKSGWKPEEVEE